MKMIPFILFTVLSNAAAQVMLKKGVMTLGTISLAGGNPIVKMLEIVFQPFVFMGIVLFVVSMASHLYVLSKVDLLFAYPFLSLAYVAVAIAAWLVFGESLSTLRIFGIAFICLGIVLIAKAGPTGDSARAVTVETAAKVRP